MRAMNRIGIGAAAILAGAAVGVNAEILVFQEGLDGYAGTSDTSIIEESGDLSAGGDNKIFVGRTLGKLAGGLPTTFRRGLLRFDVQQIPPGSTVVQVTLSIRLLLSGLGTTTDTVGLHRLTEPWGEGTVVGPGPGAMGGIAQSRDATWTHNFLDISTWTNAGGDFLPQPSATATVSPTTDTKTFVSTPELVADVQDWVNDPDANFGWILIGDEATRGSIKLFGSSEHTVSSNRPALEVEFEPSVAGDCDDDGDADLGDFLILLACLAGPGVDAGDACDCADHDGDGDVDLADILDFQAAFTGSK